MTAETTNRHDANLITFAAGIALMVLGVIVGGVDRPGLVLIFVGLGGLVISAGNGSGRRAGRIGRGLATLLLTAGALTAIVGGLLISA